MQPLIQEKAFHPRPGADDEGLSLSRRQSELRPRFLTAEQFKANNTHPDEKLRLGCGVCAVPADKAMTAGLRIVADRTETDPGHVLLPDINYPDFEGKDHTDESTVRIRIWIAKLIEAVELVIPPGTPPM